MLLIHHDCRQRSSTCHITRIVAVLSRDEVVHRPPAIVLLEERMLGKKATDADRLSWGALGEQSPTFLKVGVDALVISTNLLPVPD